MLQDVQCDFVSGIPSPWISQLETSARDVHLSPGQQLFAEGAHHADFHLILEGHVRLEMTVPGRGRTPLLVLGPGELLAWSALLSDGTMTASAIALDRVSTAAISGERLRQLCDQDPVLGYHVMKQLAVALSRRLLSTRLQLLDLFAEQQPSLEPASTAGSLDPEC